ncbi:hypothetical protein CASFOL_027031 [Castilleja foliolosa]|uniref:Splicing factor Cactin C-terminal domain-containing protein n=1 Tax=Castilleja foliolosa TaxID=1961234 RepID=A0ABD3CKR3_9LAMI
MALDRRRRMISHDSIADYLHRRAVRFSQKLKKQSTYEKFVWDKKIQRDVSNLEGNLNLYFSVKAEMKRQRQRLSEIDRLRRMKEEKKRILICYRHNNKSEEEEHNSSISDSDRDDEDFQVATPPKSVTTPPAAHDEDEDDLSGLRKPRFEYRVQTGYEWNKYNRTHYDHDSPPPKFVQGYKFDVHYPDLVGQSKVPTYEIEKDGDRFDTCILRFRGGTPYQDLAFRIVNGGDWDYSGKRGFRCTFDGGILRLYFNFVRCRYRR